MKRRDTVVHLKRTVPLQPDEEKMHEADRDVKRDRGGSLRRRSREQLGKRGVGTGQHRLNLFRLSARSRSLNDHPRKKSAINCGAATSKPTKSIIPASDGSAIVKFVAVIATTASLVARPELLR